MSAIFLVAFLSLFCCCVLGSDTKCTSRRGNCQEDSNHCSGSYHTGLCSGHASRRCCVPNQGSDTRCTLRGGHCQEDSNRCSGSYHTGLCAGHASRRCCVPSQGSDTRCTSRGGHCQEDSNHCSGSYHSGLCDGHASRRCCVPSHGSTCPNVNIIPRSTWGAKAARSKSLITKTLSEFFIHHTEGNPCNSLLSCSIQMRGIQNYHMNTRGWSDIGYSFLVGGDGNIYEGRGWGVVGAHTQGYNSKGYAASFMGSFSSHLPTAAALQAAKNLTACGVKSGYITSNYRLFGHRDAGSTSCPGDALYAEIQTWPHYSHGHP